MIKKTLLTTSLFLTMPVLAQYSVIINKTHSNYQINDNVTEPEPEPEVYGYLINLISVNNISKQNENDVTKTSEPTWDYYFARTKDVVINKVGAHSETVSLSASGTVDLFNPDKRLLFVSSKACMHNDDADSDIEYLDENGKVIFWTKTRQESAYGVGLTYGNTSDYSNPHTAGDNSLHPVVNGYLDFDKTNNTVSFTNKSEGNTEMDDWSLSNVDVSAIKKIRLSYSKVRTIYDGGSCGATVSLEMLKD